MEALEKSNLLPEAGQQKYLTEVNKRIQDSKVQEHKEPKNITEQENYIMDPYEDKPQTPIQKT